MININLSYSNAFKWYQKDNVFVKGYFFDSKNNFIEGEELCNYFDNIDDELVFEEKLKEVNGIFSVIIQFEMKAFIAVDKTSTFSLFYTFIDNKISIFDNPDNINLQYKQISKLNSNEFRACGYVTGNNTILQDVFRVRPSEFLVFKNNKISSSFFFSFSVKKTLQLTLNKLVKKQIQCFENAFDRTITALQGRQVALALSGGYDSRFIAVMLKKAGYNNVVCFTYGKKNNFELSNSRKTAEALSYKWIFIDYNTKLINKYTQDSEFYDYINYAGNYSSMPFMQEYFAVKYLKENKLIDDNAVFLPGHSGDLIGGSQLVKAVNENLTSNNISKQIFKKKYFLQKSNKSEKQLFINKIEKNIIDYESDNSNKLAYSVFENWDVHEKIPKYIFNSSKVFNFFGYKTYFPFWDNEILEFSAQLPFSLKKHKFLYDKILKEHYFEPYNLNFETEIQASPAKLILQKLKNIIKPYFSSSIQKKFLIKNDWMNYYEITKVMIYDMKNIGIELNEDVKSFNSIIIEWYLEYKKNELNQ